MAKNYSCKKRFVENAIVTESQIKGNSVIHEIAFVIFPNDSKEQRYFAFLGQRYTFNGHQFNMGGHTTPVFTYCSMRPKVGTIKVD